MADSADRPRALERLAKARALEAQGRLADARACYADAQAVLPDDPRLLYDHAQLCAKIGDLAAAASLLQRLADLRPTPDVQGLLAKLLARLGRDDEAIPLLRALLREHPEDAQAWLLLAQAFLKRHEVQPALRCAAEADRLAPSERALDIAIECLGAMGMRDDVARCLDEAARRYPHSRAMQAHLGVHLLRSGQIVEGLRLQPQIRARFSPHRPIDDVIDAARWDGEPFDGVLLVSGEQGIGEEILGSSFYALLDRLGQRAVIECDPRLIPVFARSFPGLTFCAAHPHNARRLANEGLRVKRIKVLDLAPLLFREGEFRQPRQWLQPDPARVDALRRRYDARWPGRPRVGVSWRSVRELAGEQWKSVPAERFLPVLSLPDVVAFDIQYGSVAAERQWPVAHGLPPLERDPDIDPRDDLDGLLAQMCALDAVVSVSNSTVHLAGAAGLHADVVLPAQPPVYVYWGYDGEHTPMYPALHLWRPREWPSPEALFSAVAECVRKRIARR